MPARAWERHLVRRGRSASLVASCLVAWVTYAAGCGDEQRYVGGLVQLALDATTPSLVPEEEGYLVVRERRVRFPLERPSEARLDGVRRLARERGYPFERWPFVSLADTAVQVEWSVKNLGDASARVTITLAATTDLHAYVPTYVVRDGRAVAEPAPWEQLLELAPGATARGTVHEHQVDELARDLTLIALRVAPPEQLFATVTDVEPSLHAALPAPLPGVVGVDIGLRADAPVRVVLEATVRVRDFGDVLGEDGGWMPSPETLYSRAPVVVL